MALLLSSGSRGFFITFYFIFRSIILNVVCLFAEENKQIPSNAPSVTEYVTYAQELQNNERCAEEVIEICTPRQNSEMTLLFSE